jgi:hypothetical protein
MKFQMNTSPVPPLTIDAHDCFTALRTDNKAIVTLEPGHYPVTRSASLYGKEQKYRIGRDDVEYVLTEEEYQRLMRS